MSREHANGGLWIQQLLSVASYKGNQGKITRRITAAVVVGLVAIVLWNTAGSASLSATAFYTYLSFGVLGCWLAFRVVNIPRFAEFLIAVEAEMAKVSWPTWIELSRSSIVVILVIFILTALLFVFDSFWMFLFQQLRIMRY